MQLLGKSDGGMEYMINTVDSIMSVVQTIENISEVAKN